MANTYNFSLRMPVELGESIEAMSKNDRRPMNTTVIMLLEAALKEKNRKKKNNVSNEEKN